MKNEFLNDTSSGLLSYMQQIIKGNQVCSKLLLQPIALKWYYYCGNPIFTLNLVIIRCDMKCRNKVAMYNIAKALSKVY
jgi:hypothetical protein